MNITHSVVTSIVAPNMRGDMRIGLKRNAHPRMHRFSSKIVSAINNRLCPDKPFNTGRMRGSFARRKISLLYY